MIMQGCMRRQEPKQPCPAFSRVSFCTGVFCALFHSNDAISSAKLHLIFSNYWFLKFGFNIRRTAVPPHIEEVDNPGIPQWFIDAFCDWAVGVTKNSAFVKWETPLWTSRHIDFGRCRAIVTRRTREQWDYPLVIY